MPSGIVGCLDAAGDSVDFAAVVVVNPSSPSPPAAAPSPPTIASGPSMNVLFSLNAAAEATASNLSFGGRTFPSFLRLCGRRALAARALAGNLPPRPPGTLDGTPLGTLDSALSRRRRRRLALFPLFLLLPEVFHEQPHAKSVSPILVVV